MSILVLTRVKEYLMQTHSWPLNLHYSLSGFQDVYDHVPDLLVIITCLLQRDHPGPAEALEGLLDVLLYQVCQPRSASLSIPVSTFFVILASE